VQDEPLHTGLSEATQLAVSEALTHADDLLAAACLLVDRFPHLAFHFAVLALEEVGRSELLVMVEIARFEKHEGSRGLERGLEDHVVKLFWALWGPSFGRELLTRAQIEEHRNLARNLHEKRKSGLYYDPEAPLPREAITEDEAQNVIDMAHARIGLARTHVWGPLTEERATDVRWLVEHTDDKEARRRVMSAGSMEKLVDLGDVPKWVAWMRGETEKEERVARELAERELARARSPRALRASSRSGASSCASSPHRTRSARGRSTGGTRTTNRSSCTPPGANIGSSPWKSPCPSALR
jgi:AbiV family abortive infection protein